MGKMLNFTDLQPTPKVYGLYTYENVDIYGRPINGQLIKTRWVIFGDAIF